MNFDVYCWTKSEDIYVVPYNKKQKASLTLESPFECPICHSCWSMKYVCKYVTKSEPHSIKVSNDCGYGTAFTNYVFSRRLGSMELM